MLGTLTNLQVKVPPGLVTRLPIHAGCARFNSENCHTHTLRMPRSVQGTVHLTMPSGRGLCPIVPWGGTSWSSICFSFLHGDKKEKPGVMREKKDRAWFELHTGHLEKVTFKLRNDVS